MTDEEWAAWNAPITVPVSRDPEYVFGGPRATGRPPPGHPCYDCTLDFYREQRAAGTCDGWPLHAGVRRLIYAPEHGLERRRAQWRAYRARKRAGSAA